MSDNGAWTKIKDNLVEHKNGNWLWRVGDSYEVWFLINGQRTHGGTHSDRAIAEAEAAKGIADAR